jgi:carotenoid cleavage dioxygenase
MAPRVGSTGKDDGYLVTLTTDMNENRSERLVFDARRVADGPIARVRLPERVSSDTHATWATGSSIPGWGTADTMAAALRMESPRSGD